MNTHTQTARVIYLAARFQNENKQFKKAISLYQKACDAFSRDDVNMDAVIGLANLEMAECFSQVGDLSGAELCFKRVCSIMSDRAEIFLSNSNHPSLPAADTSSVR